MDTPPAYTCPDPPCPGPSHHPVCPPPVTKSPEAIARCIVMNRYPNAKAALGWTKVESEQGWYIYDAKEEPISDPMGTASEAWINSFYRLCRIAAYLNWCEDGKPEDNSVRLQNWLDAQAALEAAVGEQEEPIVG